MYADDFCNMSISAAGLRRQDRIFEHYTQKSGLAINAAKTKVVFFGPGQSAATEAAVRLRIDGQLVEAVQGFNHIGVHLEADGGFAQAVEASASAGGRAQHGVRRRMVDLAIESSDVHFLLFDGEPGSIVLR